MTEEIEFYLIGDEKTKYKGKLTTTQEDSKNGPLIARDLRVKVEDDVKGLFSSLVYKEVVTIVVDGKVIDLYKTASTQIEYLVTTHP